MGNILVPRRLTFETPIFTGTFRHEYTSRDDMSYTTDLKTPATEDTSRGLFKWLEESRVFRTHEGWDVLQDEQSRLWIVGESRFGLIGVERGPKILKYVGGDAVFELPSESPGTYRRSIKLITTGNIEGESEIIRRLRDTKYEIVTK